MSAPGGPLIALIPLFVQLAGRRPFVKSLLFMLFTLLIFIAILAILVLAHEFGHFVVARKNGVRVEEFGFGFPPRIFGIQLLKGEKLEKVVEEKEIGLQVKGYGLRDNQAIVEEEIIDKVKEIGVVRPVKKWRLVWGGGRHLERQEDEWRLAGPVYSLNWIPLGGFVKIKGETGEFAAHPDSFSSKTVGRRALILSAGVLMNFLLAGLLLGLGFLFGLPQSLEQTGRLAKIKDPKIEIMMVVEGTPAARADVHPGDEIIKVDELAGLKLTEIQNYVDAKKGQPVKFVFSRRSQLIEKEIAPVEFTETKKGGIGVALLESGTVSYPWYLAFFKGFETMIIYSWEVLRAFWFLLVGLFQGVGVTENLAGPVGIAVLTGRVARLGLAHLLQFTALLSINLAIINFLPFPALDGGRILFLLIEKFRGRPVRQRIENLIHTFGFALLMLLVVLVTYRDVVRFGDSFVRLGKRLVGFN